ncbi:unnamed protein product [Miscanthus lutarioriparius]|uniref:Uncharacterized protein n=1 Tax=Miscanthus lutarioriparius TaxID=422564 RepID=A0A811PBZ5_9POAL|nr:unnamed protein product [Miscanthus lutarioriparius]
MAAAWHRSAGAARGAVLELQQCSTPPWQATLPPSRTCATPSASSTPMATAPCSPPRSRVLSLLGIIKPHPSRSVVTLSTANTASSTGLVCLHVGVDHGVLCEGRRSRRAPDARLPWSAWCARACLELRCGAAFRQASFPRDQDRPDSDVVALTAAALAAGCVRRRVPARQPVLLLIIPPAPRKVYLIRDAGAVCVGIRSGVVGAGDVDAARKFAREADRRVGAQRGRTAVNLLFLTEFENENLVYVKGNGRTSQGNTSSWFEV